MSFCDDQMPVSPLIGINCCIGDPTKDFCHSCKKWVVAASRKSIIDQIMIKACPECNKVLFENKITHQVEAECIH